MSLREQKKLTAWRTIRAEALRLFEEQGFQATTVDQIAEAANVSRATFFNYFDGKDAVVFDLDPGERDAWRALMAAQPDDEPLWDALVAVTTGLTESLRELMPLRRRLKRENPALASSMQDFGQQFRADLQEWVQERAARLGIDGVTAVLQMNLVAACSATAYAAWGEDEDFDALMGHMRRLLAEGRPAGR